MRVYAVSDIHIDYAENRKWLNELSFSDYKDDILILSGDISHKLSMLEYAFEAITKRFRETFFIPGNHDLWIGGNQFADSLQKFHKILKLADNYGIHTKPGHWNSLSIVPLLGWYDYTFGRPSEDLKSSWMDYEACRWPQNFNEEEITQYFLRRNERYLSTQNECVISFSHFLPRIDILPFFIPLVNLRLYPVFGTCLLERQIHRLGSQIHIYGHSHFNLRIKKEHTLYVNNALGYPYERRISRRALVCIIEV